MSCSVIRHAFAFVAWCPPACHNFSQVSSPGGETGSGFAIQGNPFLPLKNPDTPSGDVRGACSGAAMCRTKHRDRQAHHGAVVDSFVCRKVIDALRSRASPPMPVHQGQNSLCLDRVEYVLHSSGNPCASSRCRMNRSQTPLEVCCPWRI